jgi:hypothetical protein
VFEREEISRGLASGRSLRAIASQLGRSPSTICREVSRNGGAKHYRAASAELIAVERARRPKQCKLALNKPLNALVAGRLAEDWSPQQISGWLAKHHEGEPSMQVSHETIYRCLFVQARGVLKRELISRLRSRRMMRRGKTSTTDGQPRGRIIDLLRGAATSATPVVCKASVHLKAAFVAIHQSYGSRRLVTAMANAGFKLGRYKVRNLMHQAALKPVWKRKFVHTTAAITACRSPPMC